MTNKDRTLAAISKPMVAIMKVPVPFIERESPLSPKIDAFPNYHELSITNILWIDAFPIIQHTA